MIMNNPEESVTTGRFSLSAGRVPRVAAIHDISCIGRCAGTVILPVLSVCGIQACPLPTALLSTHTGGYTGFTFLDLTNEMPRIAEHWNTLGETFEAVYSGFLGSADQIELVRSFAADCKKKSPHCLFLADPVMGDDGACYATYTDEMCQKTRELVRDADIITPNVTEACILLDVPYRTDFSNKELEQMTKALSRLSSGLVVLTGIHRDDRVGVMYYERAMDEPGTYFTLRDPNNYPGTGDVFASILLAGLLAGKKASESVKLACDFIYEIARFTTTLHTPVREGLAIEPFLGKLAGLISTKESCI